MPAVCSSDAGRGIELRVCGKEQSEGLRERQVLQRLFVPHRQAPASHRVITSSFRQYIKAASVSSNFTQTWRCRSAAKYQRDLWRRVTGSDQLADLFCLPTNTSDQESLAACQSGRDLWQLFPLV